MQWRCFYEVSSDSDAEDPLPKMAGICEDSDILAPFIPTHLDLVVEALHFAGVGPGDCVLDLGSGDGRICIAATEEFGARIAVGVELDSKLVQKARAVARACSTADRIFFHEGNLADSRLDLAALCPSGRGAPAAFTLVIVYLLPEAEDRFSDKLMQLCGKGRGKTRVLSVFFSLGGETGFPGLTLTRRAGQLFLYE